MQSQRFDRRLSEGIGRLSPSELRLARHVAANKDLAILASAAQIADMAGTSDATVLRMVRGLAYDSLADMRKDLLSDLTAASSPASRMEETIRETGSDPARVLAHVVAQQDRQLRALLDPGLAPAFNTALEVLSDAEVVHVFGLGPSGIMAEYLALQLARMGQHTRAIRQSGVGLGDQLMAMGQGDAVVVFAYAPIYREIEVLLDRAEALRLPVVMVSDSLRPLVEGRVTCILEVPRGRSGHLALHSATMVVIEALALGFAARNPERSLSALEEFANLRAAIDGTWAKRGTRRSKENLPPPVANLPHNPLEKTKMHKRFAVALALTLPLLLSTALSKPAAAADLVMYDALDFGGHVAEAFTKATGLTVDVVEPGSTGETLGKIAAEGDNPQFDILWVDGSAVFQRLLQDGVVQPVPAEVGAAVKFNALGKALMPADMDFVPTGASTTAIEVNTKKVAEAEYPSSWADLAKFAGAVAAKDPNLSGPAYQWLAGFFQTNGVDSGKALLTQALSNKTLSGLGSGGKINKAVLTGDAKVGINQDSSIYAQIAKGEPVAAVYPAEGSVALPQGLGISAKTQHLDAAKKFIAFVTSPEGQAAMQDGDDTDFFFIPVIEGISAKPGRKTDISFVTLDDKAAAAQETEWKQWYKDTFVPQ